MARSRLFDEALLDFASDNVITLLRKDIGATFQEQHPEDVVLVGGRIHALGAKDVRSTHQVSFQFCE